MPAPANAPNPESRSTQRTIGLVFLSTKTSNPSFAGCSIGTNRSINMVNCSVQKLRNKMKFTGRIVLIYQAFCLTTQSEETCKQQLMEQRPAIDSARALGIDGLSPWGLDLSEKQQRLEPIKPTRGTKLEYLVTPPQ